MPCYLFDHAPIACILVCGEELEEAVESVNGCQLPLEEIQLADLAEPQLVLWAPASTAVESSLMLGRCFKRKLRGYSPGEPQPFSSKLCLPSNAKAHQSQGWS